MSLFKNRFKVLLEQDDEEIKPPQDTEQNALEGEVAPEVSPEQFGANVKPGEDIESLKQSSLETQKSELQQWIVKIEEFKEYYEKLFETKFLHIIFEPLSQIDLYVNPF